MLASPLGGLTVLYDLLTEMVHVLNPTAGFVWESCDGHTTSEQLVAELRDAGADGGEVASDIEAGIDQLHEAGLVGRRTELPAIDEPDRPTVHGSATSAVHAVIDDGVRFVGESREALDAIDDLLGFDDPRRATIDLGVAEEEGGAIRLWGWGPERTYGSREAMLEALPTALNQIAAASSTCVALHSGAVRSPDGEVLLLPAHSGSGKTTLTAALVQAGWDYGTDEAVGMREGSLLAVAYPKPLVLDATSREALGLPATASVNTAPSELWSDVRVLRGEIGAVSRVVVPRFESGAEVDLSPPLEPREAIVAVLEHVLNLRRVGQPGLDALCQLAERVPVQRLVHGGVDEAVHAVDESSSHPQG